jgi:hypothetical protein
MSKLERWDLGMVNGSEVGMIQDDEGDFVKYADIKDRLIPDEWPGRYPDSDGWWQFETINGYRFCAEVNCDISKGGLFLRTYDGRWYRVEVTKPEQWGPRVPMVRP